MWEKGVEIKGRTEKGITLVQKSRKEIQAIFSRLLEVGIERSRQSWNFKSSFTRFGNCLSVRMRDKIAVMLYLTRWIEVTSTR